MGEGLTEQERKALSPGAKAGIIALVFFVLAAVAGVLIYFFVFRKKNNNNNNNNDGSKATLKTNSISTDISNNDPVVQNKILLGAPTISPTGAFTLDIDKDTFSVNSQFTGAYNIDLNYTINPQTHRPGHDVGASSSVLFSFQESGVTKKNSTAVMIRKTSAEGKFSITNFNLVEGKNYRFLATVVGSIETHPESITSDLSVTSINDFA